MLKLVNLKIDLLDNRTGLLEQLHELLLAIDFTNTKSQIYLQLLCETTQFKYLVTKLF